MQAKRYGEKNSVGRPEVQSFVGAMHGQATQGVFITTSGSFILEDPPTFQPLAYIVKA